MWPYFFQLEGFKRAHPIIGIIVMFLVLLNVSSASEIIFLCFSIIYKRPTNYAADFSLELRVHILIAVNFYGG